VIEQLFAHLVGDYVLQSDWMALKKRTSFIAALVHALVYSLPFLVLQPSIAAWLVIMFTHLLIDHLALARYVCFAKNFLAPVSEWPKWEDTNPTGYHKDKPVWMSTWLFILADNTMHIIINYAALRWL
jgi:hypothetical protein